MDDIFSIYSGHRKMSYMTIDSENNYIVFPRRFAAYRSGLDIKLFFPEGNSGSGYTFNLHHDDAKTFLRNWNSVSLLSDYGVTSKTICSITINEKHVFSLCDNYPYITYEQRKNSTILPIDDIKLDFLDCLVLRIRRNQGIIEIVTRDLEMIIRPSNIDLLYDYVYQLLN